MLSRVSSASKTRSLSRDDWTWEAAFDLFSRCHTTQWEGMSAQMQLYNSDFKLFHHRYQKSYLQGFAPFDQHFCSLLKCWRLRVSTSTGKMQQLVQHRIHRTSCRCVICDAFDHMTPNCPMVSGPDPQRAVKSFGAVATGLDGLGLKKVTTAPCSAAGFRPFRVGSSP
jgi:hypothetical protein